ncbi:MAG: hypothetical protein JST89_12735 [Cyanobacteria bacterium SZAS-4]|nr:hypothetical protein [Cyanobacteria bacterium SZAS-4]
MSNNSAVVAILSLLFGIMCSPAALAQASSQLTTCGNGTASYVNILVPKTEDRHRRKLVSSVSTPAGQGYNTSQAGIFVSGITGGVTTTVGISYKVKPLNGSTIGCLQGPLLRDSGTASAYGAFSALNSPGLYSTITGPDADGFYTVTFTNGPNSFNSPSITFNLLGLVATNGGSFLISDFKIGNDIVPLGTDHSVSCALGQLSDATFSTYCGGP